MAQPVGRKVKEFQIYEWQEFEWNEAVIGAGWNITFEFHSLKDAVRQVELLIEEGAVLSEIKLVQNVVLKGVIKV